MTFAQRRATVSTLTLLLVGSTVFAAAPAAQATTCQSVPGATPGTDVRILGEDHRVPAISNIRVCSDGATAPLVAVDLAGHGTCLSPCLSVLLVGDDLDVGPVTVSYAEDGVARTVTNDPPGAGGPGSECLLSVGSPDAPYPTCLNAIGPDLGDPLSGAGDQVDALVATAVAEANRALAEAREAAVEADEAVAEAERIAADAQEDAVALALQTLDEVGQALEPARELVDRVRDAADDPCAAIPPQSDPQNWEQDVEFCDNPSQWTYLTVQNLCENRGCAVTPEQVLEIAQSVLCLADDRYCVS